MSQEPFHLGWFVDGFRPPAWNGDRMWSGTAERDWVKPRFFIDFARSLERACFDLMIFSDSAYVADTYEGSSRVYLKYATNAPKHDPSALAPVLAGATERLGIVPTFTTTEWHPFMLTRYMSTFDHFADGRAGWNIVTGSGDHSAQNYGHLAQPPHDTRYDMADEYLELAMKLWDSWEPDAVVMDEETGVYVDHTKVHVLNYKGQWYSSRGPAMTVPSPQGRPLLVQAGGSPKGQTFAAKYADVVIAGSQSIDQMRAFVADVRARLIAGGRKPTDCKIMFLCTPVLGETDAEAQERNRRQIAKDNAALDFKLSSIARLVALDFSKFDPDKPLPADLSTNGHQQSLDSMIKSGQTLRQLMGASEDTTSGTDLVGSPDTVAAKMGELVQEIGSDGLLITNMSVNRRYIAEIADGLAPALQRRGLIRDGYAHRHLRDNMLDF
jgi:FMN-dependent oxidoreductase (nitrilotriacetate monooxygenase family)